MFATTFYDSRGLIDTPPNTPSALSKPFLALQVDAAQPPPAHHRTGVVTFRSWLTPTVQLCYLRHRAPPASHLRHVTPGCTPASHLRKGTNRAVLRGPCFRLSRRNYLLPPNSLPEAGCASVACLYQAVIRLPSPDVSGLVRKRHAFTGEGGPRQYRDFY
jgi:hypothetical protein